MSYQPNRNPSSARPTAIRAGLTVQELKAMTAMRMAQSGEPTQSAGHNPASSYQTANPQQLQAAGIQPIVINDRNSSRPKSFRSHPAPVSHIETVAYARQAVQYQSQNLPRSSQNMNSSQPQLSPYHQQLLSRQSAGPFDLNYSPPKQNQELPIGLDYNDPWNNQVLPHRENIIMDYAKATNNQALSSSRQSLNPTNTSNSKLVSHHGEHHVFRDGEPSYRIATTALPDLGLLRSPRSPATSNALPAINVAPRYSRGSSGPEVRSPANQDRPIFHNPDEESEHYPIDSYLANSGHLAVNLENESGMLIKSESSLKRAPLNRAMSQSFIVDTSSTGYLPSLGSNISGSSSFNMQGLGTFLPIDDNKLSSPVELSSINSSPATSSKFPFKKSKTAPKLGIYSSGASSPSESPNLKQTTKKPLNYPANLSPLRDRVLDSNFLASEVAESVLDASPASSAPFGRPKLGSLGHEFSLSQGRISNILQPIDLQDERQFLGESTSFNGQNFQQHRAHLNWILDLDSTHTSNQIENDLNGNDLTDTVQLESPRPLGRVPPLNNLVYPSE